MRVRSECGCEGEDVCVLPGVQYNFSLFSHHNHVMLSVCVVVLSVGECEWVHEPSGCY